MLRSTPESGERAGYDGGKRRKGSKLHMAVGTLGPLLALHVTPVSAEERGEVERLARTVQAVTCNTVDIAYVDRRAGCQCRSRPWHHVGGHQAA